MNKIDKVFYGEEVPIHFRLFYWICRLYPSRSSEISSLTIDCIKKLVIFMCYLRMKKRVLT